MKKKRSPLVDAAPDQGASGERCSVAAGSAKPMTEFQSKIRAYLLTLPDCRANTHQIAAHAFPEKWAKRAARGAMVANVRIACEGIIDAHWLPARNHLECGSLVLLPNIPVRQPGQPQPQSK